MNVLQDSLQNQPVPTALQVDGAPTVNCVSVSNMECAMKVEEERVPVLVMMDGLEHVATSVQKHDMVLIASPILRFWPCLLRKERTREVRIFS